MKRLLITFLLVPLAAGAQFLENPGFEDGDQGWGKPDPASAVVAEAAHGGKLGLRIELKGDGDRARVDSVKFPVEAGQKVTLGFWARTASPQKFAVMLFAFNSANKPVTNENGKPLVTIGIRSSAGWTHYEEACTLPDEASTVSVGIRSWTGATGTVDLDDFELKIE